MLQFNPSNLTVVNSDINKDAVLVYSSAKDYNAVPIYKFVLTIKVPDADLSATRAAWLAWHNSGAKVTGLDESYLVAFNSNEVVFNRAFMYAYGGVSIGGNTYKISAFTYNKDLYDNAINSFLQTNADNAYRLRVQGTSILGPYAIYQKN